MIYLIDTSVLLVIIAYYQKGDEIDGSYNLYLR